MFKFFIKLGVKFEKYFIMRIMKYYQEIKYQQYKSHEIKNDCTLALASICYDEQTLSVLRINAVRLRFFRSIN